MNNTENNVPETSGEHEGLIKTPKQLIVTVLLAFIVPIAVIVLLVNLVSNTSRMGAGADAYNPEAVAARIKPVANFKLVDANAPKVIKTGQQVYESTCVACHTSGVANAPKIGDNAAWAPYIQTGYESLVKNALHGVGAMPAKGGNPTLSDFEVERAVVYIVNQSGASFPEPTEAAEGAAAPATATPATAAAPAAPAPAPAETAAAAPAATDTAAAAPAAVAPAAAPVAAADTATIDPAGEKLYKSVCFVCHATGVAGAPKQGDKDAWAPFIATGMETMLQNAIHGVGAMPPRGGSQATDAEMSAAIHYMVDSVK
ncbi:MAG: cytochrome c5 family protein [Burkholderiaceae bacterium]|nr:cytochrome c5 family protein [Burkholderiaceae bacterium]